MTHEEREYEAGRNDANAEIKRDGWTRDLARRWLDMAGPTRPDASPYSRGFDDAVRAYAEAGQ